MLERGEGGWGRGVLTPRWILPLGRRPSDFPAPTGLGRAPAGGDPPPLGVRRVRRHRGGGGVEILFLSHTFLLLNLRNGVLVSKVSQSVIPLALAMRRPLRRSPPPPAGGWRFGGRSPRPTTPSGGVRPPWHAVLKRGKRPRASGLPECRVPRGGLGPAHLFTLISVPYVVRVVCHRPLGIHDIRPEF